VKSEAAAEGGPIRLAVKMQLKGGRLMTLNCLRGEWSTRQLLGVRQPRQPTPGEAVFDQSRNFRDGKLMGVLTQQEAH
jgi:hypothetical protein